MSAVIFANSMFRAVQMLKQFGSLTRRNINHPIERHCWMPPHLATDMRVDVPLDKKNWATVASMRCLEALGIVAITDTGIATLTSAGAALVMVKIDEQGHQ